MRAGFDGVNPKVVGGGVVRLLFEDALSIVIISAVPGRAFPVS
jgi:hypothetical protein